MERKYDFAAVERKWTKNWEEKPVNVYDGEKPCLYYLVMFPYPSGNGLHVGHWRPYVISDSMSRYQMLRGNYVLQPMGWDAFGLPAENYAIELGIHPQITMEKCVEGFKRQMKDICAVYDWDREINTTDPDYYKWTQWIFVRMFKKGLAYEKEMLLNWCPSCKAVLANEEAAGGVCERCGSVATKKYQRQWMLKITEYAERLLADLELLNWPQKVIKMQADWIGKSYGAEIDFAVKGADAKIKVYTTRPDTLYGATFMAVSPEHPVVKEITAPEYKADVEKYIFDASTKSSVDRMAQKDKTGAFTGAYAVNPASGELMPVWVADYVLMDYGTGAIMCVPAHDGRDYEFAKKFGLPIKEVIAKDASSSKPLTEAYEDEGTMLNSGILDGMFSADAKEAMANYLEEKGIGKKTVNYKLRDWVFSRQRYWGEPIPLIHCEKCGVVPVPEDELPVRLPHVESYKPTDTGESPLSKIDEWVNVPCPVCGAPAKRETNTMPQWAGSSWYFLRYADPHNNNAPASAEALKKWLPVDYYFGGVEHAVLHLLYSRFYTKFLYDIGVVDFTEPFPKLFCNGMINLNGRKMSKSKGNYVSPDDIIKKYGRDALRMYILFTGPPELDSEWDNNGIDGVFRFLNRLWKLVTESYDKNTKAEKEHLQTRAKMVRDITSRLEALSLNTVVSGFMEYANKLAELSKTSGGVDRKTLETLIILLAPFAPHIAAEMWEHTGLGGDVFEQRWPECDEKYLKDDSIVIVVQINGKVRENVTVPADASKEEVLKAAKEAAARKTDVSGIIKEIYVPGKLVNFVVGK